MLTFTVTLYGETEHAERNAAQHIWNAIDRLADDKVAVLVSEAKVEPGKPKVSDADTLLH